MKRGGIIHPDLARVLAQLGHGQRICIADAGLPVPPGVSRIDLGYRLGAPPFLDVLEAIVGELVVETVTVATEAEAACPAIVAAIRNICPDVDWRAMPHEDFKAETEQARVIVRTGETTPYANVLLTSGVPF